MHQRALRGFVLFVLVSFCQLLHVPYDLKGWKALPLDNKRVVDSMAFAAEHMEGTVKDPVTAFQWIENVPDWDLYRVSFRGRFQNGQGYECHADVLWTFRTANVTVFNTGCMSITLHPDQYGIISRV